MKRYAQIVLFSVFLIFSANNTLQAGWFSSFKETVSPLINVDNAKKQVEETLRNKWHYAAAGLILISTIFYGGYRLLKKDKQKLLPPASLKSLHNAAEDGDLETVRQLLVHGAKINKTDNTGETPLHLASFYGHKEIVEMLCQYGADVNQADKYRRTPLNWASFKGHKEIVEILCKYGADINKADINGYTPLHRASEKIKGHNKEIVEILCKHGADVNQADDTNGFTPLNLASFKGDKEIVEILCMYGADINKADIKGYTPLHWASYFGHKEIVVILCKYGADFKKNNKGNTPLHRAANFWIQQATSKKQQAAIYLILWYGKYILPLLNNDGKTALDITKARGNAEMINLLSDESLLDQEIEKIRDQLFAKEMQRNCRGLNPIAYLAGREIGLRPFQIKK